MESEHAPTLGSMSRQKPDPEDAEVGHRLAKLRRERGITQAELATKLGIGQSNISLYEHGSCKLRGDLIVQIAGILHVSTDELLGREKPKDTQTPETWKLRRRLREIEKLPKRDQLVVLQTLDAFLARYRERTGTARPPRRRSA